MQTASYDVLLSVTAYNATRVSVYFGWILYSVEYKPI